MGINCEADYSGKSYPLCIPRLEETLQGKEVSILLLLLLFRFLIWIGRVNMYLFVLHILECWIKAGMGIDHVEQCGFVFLFHSIILGPRELTKNIQSGMPLQVIRLESCRWAYKYEYLTNFPDDLISGILLNVYLMALVCVRREKP